MGKLADDRVMQRLESCSSSLLSYDWFFSRFPDQRSCCNFLFQSRLGNDWPCPRCGRQTKWHLSRYYYYGCQRCGYQLRPKAGTIFARSKIDLQRWFFVALLMCQSPRSVPAQFVKRATGLGEQAAWSLGDRLRSHMEWLGQPRLLGGPGKVIEVDETFLPNVVRSERARIKVLGITDRSQVMTFITKDRKRETIWPILRKFVAPGSIVNTDGWKAYRGLEALGFEHRFVNHLKGEWVGKDGTSTLFIDGYWARLKHFLSRTHVRINEVHIGKYIKEYELRFNHRNDRTAMFFRVIGEHPEFPAYTGRTLG